MMIVWLLKQISLKVMISFLILLQKNANRAKKDGLITPENVIPYPKNPIIANFFRNIGYSDKLGSGVRKVFNYSEKYSGADPIFAESDVFRITVPLSEEYLRKEILPGMLGTELSLLYPESPNSQNQAYKAK